MRRSDGTVRDSESSDAQTTDGTAGYGRRSVLGGIAAGVAAPVAVEAAMPGDGVFGRAAAAGRDPTEDWTSSPTDSGINGIRSREGYLIVLGSESIVSLDQSSGEVAWEYQPESNAPGLNLHEGRPYIVDGQTVLSLDESGNERWSTSFDSRVNFEVRGDAGYVSSGTTLAALSLADGSTRWTTESEGLQEVRGVTENRVLTTEGGSSSETVAAYNPSDGSEVWRTEVATNVSLTTTSFGRERIYYGHGSTMSAISVSDGSIAWSREFDQSGLPFIFELGGTAYLFQDGKMAELSGQDGSEVWTLEFEGFPFPNDFIGGSLGSLEDIEALVIATRTTVQVVNLDGTRQWSYETQDTENFSRATAVGDLVYATDGDRLLELDAGEATWEYSNDGTTLRTAASDSDRVYAADAATVHAFQHGVEGVEETTSTTAAPGGETTAPPQETTAPSGGTTVPMTESTTEAGGSGGTDTMAGTDTEGGDGGDGDGGSPGFGVLATVVAGLLAGLRLLGDESDDGD